ncbi:lysophospholipid acyltransferase family protein [Gluconobacter sp. P1C6_b]|uniref:lysophospholipid acyltransferase family protein n=1 Tax=Gluconobacter sp. P1C6_b TaxID=2762619 RepID=UPI001C0537E5|nr:lauroyl acyltransferase [Gluconobacter sp. P1C6_b]
MAPITPILCRLSRHVQSVALSSVISLLRNVSPRYASTAGGWLMRKIGMRLRATRIADRNLHLALPELPLAERQQIIRDVWTNLGQNVAELPYLSSFTRTDIGPGWEITGEEHIDALKANGSQALFFSGHLGNWELILPIATSLGMPVAGFYRASSNPVIDLVTQSMRQKALGATGIMFPKGPKGARQALAHLQSGGSLGFLVDQKMNDGLAIPFFGRDAMTAPAVAQLALRFNLPIIPVYIVRLGEGRFRMVCEAPLQTDRTGDRHADIRSICIAMNETLERWIRERPGAWLWLHRRWPKEAAVLPTV